MFMLPASILAQNASRGMTATQRMHILATQALCSLATE